MFGRGFKQRSSRRAERHTSSNPLTLSCRNRKVSGDLLAIIRERPAVVAELLRSVRRMPVKKVSKISRKIRDGDW